MGPYKEMALSSNAGARATFSSESVSLSGQKAASDAFLAGSGWGWGVKEAV